MNMFEHMQVLVPAGTLVGFGLRFLLATLWEV
jgi:hypothetical protein